MIYASLSPRGNCLALLRLAGVAVLLLAVAVLPWQPETAQAQPVVEWTASLGGNGDEFAHSVALAQDGGFVIAGETRSYGAGFQDGWLVKLNADGVQQWSRTFGGPEDDILHAVQATSDGGFVLAGETHSFGGSTADRSSFWLIRTDSEGALLWQRTYGTTDISATPAVRNSDAARAVRQTADGGFVLAGSTTGSGGTSVRLVRTDSDGGLLWSRDLEGLAGAVAYDVAVTLDGLVIAGSASSQNSGSDAFLVVTDASGNPGWSRTYGGSYNDEARSLTLTADGGFALGGFTWSSGAGQSDFWLLKTDSSGEQQWERSFGGVLRDSAHSLTGTGDGGFALAGWSESFRGGDRFWVLKTDAEGRLQWSSSHEAAGAAAQASAGARSIVQTGVGGFIVAGWTGTISGARDIMAVRMGPVLSGQPTPSGAVASLKNTGTVAITSAAVGYDTVFFGQPLRFWYQDRLIDRDNPLPSGAVACTQPAPGIMPESILTLDQIGSFDTAFLGSLSAAMETNRVEIDGDSTDFEFPAGDGVLSGRLSAVSDSPCELGGRLLPEGPRAPVGLSGEASDSYPGSITLDWADNTESDIFGYAVYVSRNRTGPFVRRAWLLSDSAFADSGVTDGSSYYYAVSATNSWGLESPKSTVIRVPSRDFRPPDPPSGLRVSAIDRDSGMARLSWGISTSADLSGYRVYRQGETGARSPVTALLFTPEFEDRTLPAEGEFSYSVTAIDLAGNESEWSNIAPSPLDFFGLVLEVRRSFAGGGMLSVDTSRGRVDVEVAPETEVRVPNIQNADLGDLEFGDKVAVSLRGGGLEAVARQVHLIPTKTRNRHVSGLVSRLSQSEIVVQPHGDDTEPVTFQLSDAVQIKLRPGVPGLAEGQFVIVSFIATEGQAAGAVTEINVIPGREREESPVPPEGPANVAIIRGVFQGINPENANLILSSTEVALDVYTVMTTGLSAGDSVLVEAVLRADGTLLARRVEHDSGVGQTAARTVLRGVFEGSDAGSGQWQVSGALITVDSNTYADALPSVGQRVKVTAILREDGSLYAREIENRPETVDLGAEYTVTLEGLFREITPEGAWNVGGIPVQVDANTSLSGRPSVGRQVAVTAVARGSGMLATEVSGAPTEAGGPERSVSIRGTVDLFDEGRSLVVDGIRLLISDLTKTIGDIGAGSNVRVKADLQLDGDLLAREVAQSAAYDETGEPRANPVDIEGRIEQVGADGRLTVNGIPVAVSALTTIEAAIQVGAPVQVRGLLQLDGSVLAREIVGYGPGVTGGIEASVTGVVERIITASDGQTTGFVIDGIRVATDQLTRLEVELTVGVAVVAEAIVINGEILAVTVEPRPTGSIGVLPLVQMQGTVETPVSSTTVRPLDIRVNAITVRVSEETGIRGTLQRGAVIRVTGSISAGVFLAREIEIVRPFQPQIETGQARFNVSGELEEILLDSEGEPETILLAGNTITIVPLTVFLGEVDMGDTVSVEGIVRDGMMMAALVRLSDTSGGQASN